MPFLLLIVWVVLEAWIVARLVERFGSLPVLAWLALAVVAGVFVIRQQGLRAVREIQASAMRGELPAQPLLEGAVALIGGLLLILPGLLSDVFGITLLFAALRRRLARRVRAGIAKARPDLKQPVTLEGEYERRQ